MITVNCQNTSYAGSSSIAKIQAAKVHARWKHLFGLDLLDEADDTQAYEICVRLAETPTLCCFLWSLLQSDTHMQRIQRDSYTHNNGFHKIVLWHSAAGHKVRLHYYDSACTRHEDVHDHRWSFASAIVHGTLCQDHLIYEEDDDNNQADQPVQLRHSDLLNSAMHRYTYNADKQSGEFQVIYHGPVAVRVHSRVTHTRGQSYKMDTVTLHRITDVAKNQRADVAGRMEGDGECVTLVITNPPSRSSCTLLSNRTVDTARTKTRNYTRGELYNLFIKIMLVLLCSDVLRTKHSTP